MSTVDDRAEEAWKEYLAICDYDNTDEQQFFTDGWRGGKNAMSDLEQAVVDYVAAFRSLEQTRDNCFDEPSESNLRRMEAWRDETERLFGILAALADERKSG